MNWINFKEKLESHSNAYLQFEYDNGKLVKPGYHITEIKQAQITSVDCGGALNNWNEVIMQVMEGPGSAGTTAMPLKKALSIINLVESKLMLDGAAMVKVEFGNQEFDTRQLHPTDVIANGEYLTVKLAPDFTQCKANARGQNCGPKPSVQLVNLAAADTCCTPGGGCC